MGSRKEALEKLSVGTYGSEGDVLDWTYYDVAALAAATLTHQFFTTPLGQAGKTLADTNLTLAGQIPQGQLMDIRAIKIFYTTNGALATADVQSFYTMLDQTTVSIKLENKDTMGQWTLQELLGVSTLAAMTPTAAGDNIPLISPKFHGVFPLNNKIVLAAMTPFKVTVQHHTAVAAGLADDRLKIGLAGILTRVT